MRATSERVSFITDDIIVQRFVEIDGALEKVLAVVKMRGSEHATDFRTYHSDPEGREDWEVAQGVSWNHDWSAEIRRYQPRS